MVNPAQELSWLVRAAAKAAFGEIGQLDAMVHRSSHADFQADMALALARILRQKPHEVAHAILAHLARSGPVGAATVSGPGFINIICSNEYLSAELTRMFQDTKLGIDRGRSPATVVVDYSSPNLAKEMHVGHLRSTIIGDAISRILEFSGDQVVRQNHIGDWGTPFGMLIEEMLDEGYSPDFEIGELSRFYRAARQKFDSTPQFAARARRRVVLLQRGDPETLEQWRTLIRITSRYINDLYRTLNVRLTSEDSMGESRYNLDLPEIAAELEHLNVARYNEGALCAFPTGFFGRDGKAIPLIIRKQDGGFSYAATDLAALKHRVRTLRANRILYVVGAPQSQHLQMVFETARMAGWIPNDVQVEHVAFGSILGDDGKVLRTRAGEAVSLLQLIEEAVARAKEIADKSLSLSTDEERMNVAKSVGIGAIKYADLCSDRIRDYVFNWTRMLAFEGNTAPYLMYAHARICSVLRRARISLEIPSINRLPLIHNRLPLIHEAEERSLALELLLFPSTVVEVGETLQLHRLCQHLYRIASAFSIFYDTCPVLQAPDDIRNSRLVLCELAARVLSCGLNLLGIDAPSVM